MMGKGVEYAMNPGDAGEPPPGVIKYLPSGRELQEACKLWGRYNDTTIARLYEQDYTVDDIENPQNDYLLMLYRWADGGLATITTRHDYASALMLTERKSTDLDDIIVPWKTFRTMIPDGLVKYHSSHIVGDEKECSINRLIVGELGPENYQILGIITDPSGYNSLLPIVKGPSIDSILYYQHEETAFNMCINLVHGLLRTMQHTRNWKETEKKNKFGVIRQSMRRPPPTHRNVVCGKPMNVNLTPVVKSIIRGELKRGPKIPSMFQCQVRGHFKRQVIGIGRTGRKVVWIEPYWRGHEDAPIMVRDYRISGAR